MESVETGRRRLTALAGTLAVAVDHRDRSEIGGPGFAVLADVARLSPAEARRRIRDTAQLRPRTTLTGQPLPPELPATADAWHTGALDPEHLRVIQKFLRELPPDLHPAEVAKAEAFLAEQARSLRPDQLHDVAALLALRLNPDGRFSDEHRARQRSFTWCGRQRLDGMSEARLTATPQLRATLEALFAKYAAPGTGTDAPGDPRSTAQRQHDALAALLHSLLGNPQLGTHNGLPVTIVATASVEQLSAAAAGTADGPTGHAVTADGTRLPISDLIAMASHAWHYLCVYREHDRRPLYLGRTRRIASADQRLALTALMRGCTFPNCDKPAILTEVHHITDWACGGHTDIPELTLACHAHHRLLTPGGWTTRRLPNGQTEWIPPPQHPHLKGGTNTHHHPEKLLADGTGEPGETADP